VSGGVVLDFATIGGIVLAIASLIIGFTFDGGSVASLLNPAAFILVVGGTLGATMTSVSMKEFGKIFAYMKMATFHRSEDPLDSIDNLVDLATVARREGILALEERIEEYEDRYLKSGLQLVVDGVDPELVKNMLETELSYIEERHAAAAHIFEMAGGFAPTMGIIGTVMGLVHVLGSLSDVAKLGPQIAVAFTATLYGVSSANILWLPISNKLKLENAKEVVLREIMMEGILSIQAGENPNVLRQKLLAFLLPANRERKQREEMGESNVTQAQA
jgi:chemotaxis protein MotA